MFSNLVHESGLYYSYSLYERCSFKIKYVVIRRLRSLRNRIEVLVLRDRNDIYWYQRMVRAIIVHLVRGE